MFLNSEPHSWSLRRGIRWPPPRAPPQTPRSQSWRGPSSGSSCWLFYLSNRIVSGFSIRERGDNSFYPLQKVSQESRRRLLLFCFSQRRQQTSLALSYRKIHERNARAAANSPEPLHVSISHHKYFLPISQGNAGKEFGCFKWCGVC